MIEAAFVVHVELEAGVEPTRAADAIFDRLASSTDEELPGEHIVVDVSVDTES